MPTPTISIITVVFNGEEWLETTIQSVLGQTWKGIEYIVVDGASTDRTIDIIRQYAGNLSQWISEPDKGIYDAMSKGLRMATGDYVWFLNCGDRLYESSTVEQMLRFWTPDTDVLYGDSMLVDESRKPLGLLSTVTVHRLPEALTWQRMKYGMNVCHQSFIARRALAEPFIEDNLVADLDWVIQILKKSRHTVHTRLILSEFLAGGISKQRHRRSLWDRYAILKHHFGFFPNILNHLYIIARAIRFQWKNRGKMQY